MAEAVISTSVPRFMKKDINNMKDQILTMNLDAERLPSTGTAKEKRDRLMEHFYPATLSIDTDPNVIPSTSDTVQTNSNVKEKPFGSPVENITKEVNDLKVVPLRERLRTLGLDDKGLKQVLRDRLLDHLLADSMEEILDEVAGLLDFQRQGSVIKQIPKASRIQAGKSFAEILRKVILNNDLESWGQLFRFARDYFGKPNRGGKKQKSLATLINERLQGQPSTQSTKSVPAKKAKKKEVGPNFKTQTADKLKLCDIKGAIRVISSDDKILPVTEENRDKLKKKHPGH